MRVYVSAESHSSIDKAMDILGLGINNLVKIEVDNEFKLQPKLLREKIVEDLNKNLLPIGVIGTAGTTNTGSIDPLEAISKISEEFNLWFMVDLAYSNYYRNEIQKYFNNPSYFKLNPSNRMPDGSPIGNFSCDY